MNFLCFEIYMFRTSYVLKKLCFNVLFPKVFLFWYLAHGHVANVFVSRCHGVNKAKCIIFNANDRWKLTFTKPRKTLIYSMHVPRYFWWTIMKRFMAHLIGGGGEWVHVSHLSLSCCYFFILSCGFDGVWLPTN